MSSGSKRVYKVWSAQHTVLVCIFGLGLVVVYPIMIRWAIADGGMYFGGRSSSGSDTWIPAPFAVPFICLLGLVILFLIARICLEYNRRITVDDMGITETDLWRKVCFRARWDQIVGLSEDLSGNTVVNTSCGTWLIDNNRAHIGAILSDIREHTGLTPQ